jgi:serine/threonine protein kinase
LIGTTILHYHIIEKLGEGGMGVVYLAKDTKLERKVAIKFLPHHIAKDSEERKRFEIEAKAAAALNHPNIATIYTIEEAEGEIFIVMEYIEGSELSKVIGKGEKTTPLPVDLAIRYAEQIAQGLQAAHERGIVHRDIKSSNIMITGKGNVKIMDFGLAKFRGSVQLTQAGTTVGTAAYMSPEQARSEEVDHRTDIWSFGIVLYKMLTGKPPFHGDYEQAVIYAILNEEPVPIRKRYPDITKEIERMVKHCLEKKRENRYISIEEILTELGNMQSAAKSSDGEFKLIRFLLRYPLRMRIIIPAAVILLGLVIFIFWFFKHNAKIQWAKEIAIPQIIQLIDNQEYKNAFQLAEKAEQIIPEDSLLASLWPMLSNTVSFPTKPQGADIYLKDYRDITGKWEYLGKSPIDSIRIADQLYRCKIEKEGFETIEMAYWKEKMDLELELKDNVPEGMIHIPAAKTELYLIGFKREKPIQLNDYYIDKYEVTNKQYKTCMDGGGYQNSAYWKYPFIKNGRTIPWEEAMKLFVDATGRPGPATWEVGTYPEGEEDYPVAGISWYEAAAYAEFAGKQLPTVYHWAHAADIWPFFYHMNAFSNFDGNGPAPVGSYKGLTYFGTYDMAGNVREWCLNKSEGKFCIQGGGWNDPSYAFRNGDTKSAFDRSVINGLRCAKYTEQDATLMMAMQDINLDIFRDYYKEKPVSDDVFNVITNFYSYDKAALNPKIELVDTSSQYWKKEKITYNAGYGNERIIAYLFTPAKASPPFATMIIFPGAGVFDYESSENGNNLGDWEWTIIDAMTKSGMAVLYPIYKSTYERRDGYSVYSVYDAKAS